MTERSTAFHHTSPRMSNSENQEHGSNISQEPRFSASSIFQIDECINDLIQNPNKLTEIKDSEISSESSDNSLDPQLCQDTKVQINCNIPKLNEIIPIPIEDESLVKICFIENLEISSKNDENEFFDFSHLEDVGKLSCSINYFEDVLISLVKSNEDFLDFISFNTQDSKDSIHYSKNSGQILNIFPSASFILLARYLVVNGFSGKTVLDFESKNGEGLISNIIVEEPKLRKFRGMELHITRITQNDEEFITYFLESGHILRHESKNSPFLIHLNPLSSIPPQNLMNLAQHWENDIQLYSIYLDTKDFMKNESFKFLKDNPQIKNLIKDYLSALLVSKPEDVIEFSVDFFRNIAGISSVKQNMDYDS